MAVLRCKMCNAELHPQKGESNCICEFCGTENDVLSLDTSNTPLQKYTFLDGKFSLDECVRGEGDNIIICKDLIDECKDFKDAFHKLKKVLYYSWDFYRGEPKSFSDFITAMYKNCKRKALYKFNKSKLENMTYDYYQGLIKSFGDRSFLLEEVYDDIGFDLNFDRAKFDENRSEPSSILITKLSKIPHDTLYASMFNGLNRGKAFLFKFHNQYYILSNGYY